MKKLFTIVIILLIGSLSFSQQIVDLDESAPYEYNGFEYGFYISNERSKEVKGDDFERYEINLYITNKSGCLKLIPFKNSSTKPEEEIVVGEFNCKNATGKRLTAKSGKINAKAWYSQVKLYDETQSSKYKFVNAMVGYAIRNGETLTNKIIVIVPKGEKPKMSCRAVYFPEF
ncbi:MAG TPA: hypothetical protein VFD24_09690 [Chitinophagaceae bacterium]|nr:hypothetical protein [Chitinophagaceae bacterium]